MSWLCIHVCLLFPLQSKAEEQNVPEQNINEVNVQEQPEQVEMKQDKEEQQEAKINKKPKKDRDGSRVITVNKPELKVGEEVLVIVEPKEKNVQSIKGILRLPKTASV